MSTLNEKMAKKLAEYKVSRVSVSIDSIISKAKCGLQQRLAIDSRRFYKNISLGMHFMFTFELRHFRS